MLEGFFSTSLLESDVSAFFASSGLESAAVLSDIFCFRLEMKVKA
jgi:hypothetical protein